MIGTISAADFILALKRYRDEVGQPASTKASANMVTKESLINQSRTVLAGNQEKRKSGPDMPLTQERKPEAGTLPPSLPAKRERKLTTKEEKRAIAEKQGSLF